MPRILATYRLQLHRGFGFADAASLVEYLRQLGISHVYTSPVLRARAGSSHGYDVVDPTCLNPELGSKADHAQFVRALHTGGMGWMLDIVPNHMATGPENQRWEEVLTHGQASPYARWFDIDWRSPDPELRGRILIPVLGDHRTRVLERKEITLTFADGTFRVCYFEHSFPIDPATLTTILRFQRDRLAGSTQELRAFDDLVRAFTTLPGRRQRDRRQTAERVGRAAELRQALADLAGRSDGVRIHLERVAGDFTAGPDGRGRLNRLLRRQVYRLVYWRKAGREINYRRFFDINDLVALRMEDPKVFEESHGLILQWVAENQVDALRIDHVDGLLDPRSYLDRLSTRATEFAHSQDPFPIYVEKILGRTEELRRDWPVAGSTGYDFLNELEAVLLDPDGVGAIENLYHSIVRRGSAAHVAHRAKRRILRSRLSAYVRGLARTLARLNRTSSPHEPIPLAELTEALVEFIAALPVYRTYIDARTTVADKRDLALVADTAREARRRGGRAVDLLEAMITRPRTSDPADAFDTLLLRFIQRLQQLSGPAAAKGIEDTAFYVHVPLVSRNEVGADPGAALDTALDDFHDANCRRAGHWPRAMLAVTTHDTKRSADVRARIDVLSELPPFKWPRLASNWRKRNRSHRSRHRGRSVPDFNTEYLLYQTLIGIWPVHRDGHGPDAATATELRERIDAYMLKAAREAKERTSWINPDAGFEEGLHSFVHALFADNEFLAELTKFVNRIAPAGFWNALSRTLLQHASPGIPDIYQGDELWNFTLVDPDNRRPVDYDIRTRALELLQSQWRTSAEARQELLGNLLADPCDGRIKLFVIWRCLQARAAHPNLFVGGTYEPLSGQGARAEHLVTFARRRDDAALIAVAPRLTMTLLTAPFAVPTGADVWADTCVTLPPDMSHRVWRCVFTGREHTPSTDRGALSLSVAELFHDFPLSLLIASG